MHCGCGPSLYTAILVVVRGCLSKFYGVLSSSPTSNQVLHWLIIWLWVECSQILFFARLYKYWIEITSTEITSNAEQHNSWEHPWRILVRLRLSPYTHLYTPDNQSGNTGFCFVSLRMRVNKTRCFLCFVMPLNSDMKLNSEEIACLTPAGTQICGGFKVYDLITYESKSEVLTNDTWHVLLQLENVFGSGGNSQDASSGLKMSQLL